MRQFQQFCLRGLPRFFSSFFSRVHRPLSIRLLPTLLLATAAPLVAPAQADDEAVSLSRTAYADKLHGFWLGQSIANWTGLTTEMVRVAPPFLTDKDWGTVAKPAIWGKFPFHSGTIDYFLLEKGKVWGADDDTDIEYMYQYLMEQAGTGMLTAEAIRDGWLKHVYANDDAPISPNTFERENFLWVANERARDLMAAGMVPPATRLNRRG